MIPMCSQSWSIRNPMKPHYYIWFERQKQQELPASDSRLKNQRRFRTETNLTTTLFFRDIPEINWGKQAPLIRSYINTLISKSQTRIVRIISKSQTRIVKRMSIHPFIYSFSNQEISTKCNHAASDGDTIINNIRQSP